MDRSGGKPLLWFGEDFNNPLKKDRSSDFVMDSVFYYYSKENPKLPYIAGELFLDNGAYAATMKNIELASEKVVFVQEKLNPSKAIPLDYPFKNGMSNIQMRKRWKRTTENIIYWQSSTMLTRKLVPSLHAWDKQSLIENLQWLQKFSDAEYVAIGSLVGPDLTRINGFFGDRQPSKGLIDMLSLAIEYVRKFTDFKIHFMGFGSSPLTLHIGYYLGVNSTDSAGYRRKAAFGSIVLPGSGERYLGNGSAKFGATPLNNNDLTLLKECGCNICKINQDQLWDHWAARALHNEYVMKKEKEIAQKLISRGENIYEAYLEKMYNKSRFLYLWKYGKLKKKYNRMSNILFGER